MFSIIRSGLTRLLLTAAPVALASGIATVPLPPRRDKLATLRPTISSN